MNILTARRYPTPRNGLLSLAETETRRLAYAIKSTASPSMTSSQAMCGTFPEGMGTCSNVWETSRATLY